MCGEGDKDITGELWLSGRPGGVNMATAATNNNTRHTGQAAHTQHTTQISPHFLLLITSLARPGPGPAASRGICFMSTSTIRRETKRALPIGWHWSSGEKQHSSNSAGTLRQTSGNKLTGGAATQGCFIIVLGFSC